MEIDRNGHDGSNHGTHLLLMNIHDGTPLLKLLFPFDQPPYSITFSSDESGIYACKNCDESGNVFNEASGEPSRASSRTCLAHDPIADRVAFLRFNWRYGDTVGIFISLSKILWLLPSPSVTSFPKPPVLNWTDWGPSSTRVFHSATYLFSICGSRGLLVTNCETLIRYSGCYSGTYAETPRWIFLDFNQRLIRHQAGSSTISLKQYQTGKSPNTDREETQVLEAKSSNNTRMETVTETWVLNSKNAAHPIESSLPFRILVSDRFGDYLRPDLGMDYFVAGKVWDSPLYHHIVNLNSSLIPFISLHDIENLHCRLGRYVSITVASSVFEFIIAKQS
jgi:hypothetical protein